MAWSDEDLMVGAGQIPPGTKGFQEGFEAPFSAPFQALASGERLVKDLTREEKLAVVNDIKRVKAAKAIAGINRATRGITPGGMFLFPETPAEKMDIDTPWYAKLAQEAVPGMMNLGYGAGSQVVGKVLSKAAPGLRYMKQGHRAIGALQGVGGMLAATGDPIAAALFGGLPGGLLARRMRAQTNPARLLPKRSSAPIPMPGEIGQAPPEQLSEKAKSILAARLKLRVKQPPPPAEYHNPKLSPYANEQKINRLKDEFLAQKKQTGLQWAGSDPAKREAVRRAFDESREAGQLSVRKYVDSMGREIIETPVQRLVIER